jgi:hypothetical protein
VNSNASYRHSAEAHPGLLAITVPEVLKAATQLLETVHG